MSFFQSSVVTKHVQLLNKETVAAQWQLFKNHFHNPVIQQNIRNSKEEQYQGEFLIDLFVNVLGYTKNPQPNFNLTTECKNVKDAKKADGAISINDVVKAVIELKGTETTDLNKIETQAFGYKNNQPSCNYIITSNFEKLRFYIDNAIDHIEFNLFTLTEKEFEVLYVCLSYESIAADIPKKIKTQSVSQEDVITKKLYNDYSLFKRELHQNLVALNPQFDALVLFKKSQKLLDRFLFLFFAEDRQLLPPNSVRLILTKWESLNELYDEYPLYGMFKNYFKALNTGRKGDKYDIFAYNGGLFKPDEVLDAILIEDHLLFKHAKALSEYDFESEVDVNILGHIFENSLNELDEIQAELTGETVDKTKTKRKKDGVFYTPKYITKYIVDNTVGKLCEEQKTALQLNENDYITDKKRQKKTIKDLLDKLTTYRNWLLQLTICDPACGSGAFLNQALNFLIAEHKYIDELQAKLFGDAMVLSDVEKSILENNLFGVDLNEESVEIAKLSLWLRTAQPNRKLNDLNNNIKCGNSLIDDVTIAGDKAFNWQQEFPQIFKEKNKKAFHITTAVHDSRTSQLMLDYKVREKRDFGTNPYPTINYFTDDDNFIITQTIATIVKEDQLKVLAYNICADHIHLLLVCEEENVSKIVQKIKSVTSKEVHKATREKLNSTREHAPLPEITQKIKSKTSKEVHKATNEHATKPLWTQKFGCKEIESEIQLTNTIEYIKNNRVKHNLPTINKGVCSLVENMVCSFDAAFITEYKGGFDVVIGNPPYGASLGDKDINYFRSTYKSVIGHSEVYYIFTEKAIKSLTKQKGLIGFIIPNAWLSNKYAKKLREILITTTSINNLINFNRQIIFEDANVETSIFILKNVKPQIKNEVLVGQDLQNQYYFIQNEWYENDNYLISFASNSRIDTILKNINSSEFKLSDKLDISNGFKPYQAGYGVNLEGVSLTTNDVKNRIYHSELMIDNTYKKEIKGKGVKRYSFQWEESYIKWGKWLMSPKNEYYFEQPKILVRQVISDYLFAYLDYYKYYADQSLYVCTNFQGRNESLEFYTALLNSKLYGFYFRKFYSEEDDLFPKIKVNELKNLPVKEANSSFKLEMSKYSTNINDLIKELQEVATKFQRTIQRKFEIEPLPKKLQDWYLLSYAEFIKELSKKKVKLSLSEEAEWEDYFVQESKKALDLKAKIDTTDKEIDAMVYALYGLTEEEIAIVESSH